MGEGAIDRRVRRGRLHVVHRGVYAVGHRVLSPRGRWMAAVLAAGPGAVLSHRSAAALWGIRPTSRARVDVTVRRSRRARPGIDVHSADIRDDETTTVDGIPVTTVARTILDLAAVVPAHHTERAINEAEVRRLAETPSLGALVARYPRRRGTRTINRILETSRIGQDVTGSELESRFLAFLDAHGIPRPEVNQHIHIGDQLIEADCLWRAQKVIVELDARSTHDTETAFEDDRAKDRAFQVAGYRPIRVTWRQLHQQRPMIAADLNALLASSQ
jgi:very-short-patch-repair endonuclease